MNFERRRRFCRERSQNDVTIKMRTSLDLRIQGYKKIVYNNKQYFLFMSWKQNLRDKKITFFSFFPETFRRDSFERLGEFL